MEDYHDVYLITDTLLLEDGFEIFRNICLATYDLHSALYYTAPALAWYAALKLTNIKLDTLTDINQYLFIEQGLRGEHLKITCEITSTYSQALGEALHYRHRKVEKLVPSLHNKEKYILHHRNLKLYLDLRMKLSKIHGVLQFKQEPWLKQYIDLNTQISAQAKNGFEKDFYKLTNNSVFGKTMQNIRKHVKVELVIESQKMKKLVAKPTFKVAKQFNEHLVVHAPQVSSTHLKLLSTDIDSLCYQVFTDHFYRDIQPDLEKFDTADYPKQHVLHSPVNKKVIGKFKDETSGCLIRELVGLRPQIYSFILKNDGKEKEKKTAKG
ncbi:unnamed protein product, partial [Porites evermanni]